MIEFIVPLCVGSLQVGLLVERRVGKAIEAIDTATGTTPSIRQALPRHSRESLEVIGQPKLRS